MKHFLLLALLTAAVWAANCGSSKELLSPPVAQNSKLPNPCYRVFIAHISRADLADPKLRKLRNRLEQEPAPGGQSLSLFLNESWTKRAAAEDEARTMQAIGFRQATVYEYRSGRVFGKIQVK